jgi:hypothetical protein
VADAHGPTIVDELRSGSCRPAAKKGNSESGQQLIASLRLKISPVSTIAAAKLRIVPSLASPGVVDQARRGLIAVIKLTAG